MLVESTQSIAAEARLFVESWWTPRTKLVIWVRIVAMLQINLLKILELKFLIACII